MWGGRFAPAPTPSWRRSTPRSTSTGTSTARTSPRRKAHAAMLGQAGHHRGRRCRKDRARSRHDPVRNRGRQVQLQARARRHPHERREPARRADRRRRPGGCTPRARATTRSRPISGCGCATRSTRIDAALAGLSAGAGREGAGACRHRDAGLHPSADRAAGDLRPSSARLCRDGGARPRPLRRCAQRGSTNARSAPPRSPARRSRSTAT